jgi:predicted Zn-dependent peptidase
MINYSEHTLSNGLRVFLAPMKETQAVTILSIINVGSRFETKEQNGLSHFLEHMFFKGTEKRPTTLDISHELDALGAEYNAFTGEEFTGYYVSTAAEHFPIAFDVLTDMLYNSKFEAEEIEREKGVILEEIKMYHENPSTYLNEIEKHLTYGDTPLGRDIAGTPSTVKAFTRDDFIEYKKTFYGPENTILVIAGNPDTHDWLKLVTENLSPLSPGKARAYEKQSRLLDTPKVKVGHRPIDQVHLSLSHYAFSHTDERTIPLGVLSNILGGTMSSRLFVEVRERRGLAYYVRSSSDSYHDIGSFACMAGVDAKKLDQAVETILEQIKRLQSEEVADIELERAKQNIKGRLSLRLEDSQSIARYLATDILEYGKIEQPEDYISKVEKVTKSDIMEIAQEIFKPEHRKLAMVGPIETEQQERLEQLLA